MLLKASVLDEARRGARIFRTPGKVSCTGRDDSKQQDVNPDVATARLNSPSPSSNSISISPARTGTQDISDPRRSIIARRVRKADPLDVPIHGFLDVNGNSTSIFSKVIGVETVPGESDDINLRGGMNFAINSVLSESPNFVDLGLSPANAADKLKSVFAPSTRVEGLKDNSNWLASSHG